MTGHDTSLMDPVKQTIRDEVWSRLERARAAAFPGARGRIPNFAGAAAAAERLASTPEWKAASVVKCNPDSPQRPVRFRALSEGKIVYMAVPRLRSAGCFWKLDPSHIDAVDFARAASIRGASRLGRAVDPRRLPHIDLVVAGSVAVNRGGARIGKGGGYSDLEYGIGRTVGAIDRTTIVATTVHPIQVLDRELPMTAHDFWLDLIVTPDEVIRYKRSGRRQPSGVLLDHLSAEQRRQIPILRRLRGQSPNFRSGPETEG